MKLQNKLAEAESLHREALEIRRVAFPANHPAITLSMNNLASLLQAQRKFAEAEKFYLEVLGIDRDHLPNAHPDIALHLNNLASLRLDQKRFGEAEPLFREALGISRVALPAGHPRTAMLLNNLALVLQLQNKLAEAEQLYFEALTLKRAVLPADHPDIAVSLFNLASHFVKENKPAEAESLYHEAIEILRTAFPDGHRENARAMTDLAKLLQDQKRLDEARPLLHESLEIQRRILPKDSPKLASELVTFSQTLLGLKSWDEAEKVLRECLAIREKANPDAWNTFNTQSMLGAALLGQKKFAEAEPWLLKGYDGMKEREAMIPPEGKTRIPESLERLVELYRSWHAAEPDKDYETKAAEWQTKLEEHNAAVGTSLTHQTVAPIKIKLEDVGKSLGKSVIVELTIRSTGVSKVSAWLYLNSEEDYRNPNNFSVAIRFPTPDKLRAMGIDWEKDRNVDRRISVTGKVTKYRESLEIIVDEPDQITVIP